MRRKDIGIKKNEEKTKKQKRVFHKSKKNKLKIERENE